jgi:predicted ArsR family transcriptional regulator
VYRVTSSGLRQLGDNYADLAQILWRELRGIEEPAIRRRVVDGIRNALIQRYGPLVYSDSLRERVKQLQSALIERGFDVEADESGVLPILRENNCPYHELADADSTICELEQEVFESVLGAEVTLTQCCRDGHNCCEFQAGEIQFQSNEA